MTRLKSRVLSRYNLAPRKRGRVVDCTGLENRRLERVREFESHRFRQESSNEAPFGALFYFVDHLFDAAKYALGGAHGQPIHLPPPE